MGDHTEVKVIIVEDEYRIRSGIEKLTVSAGADFRVVGSFEHALLAYDTIKNQCVDFDILITDIKTPFMDGLTLIQQLRAEAEFEAIIISGYDDFKFLQTAIREHVFDYLLKPLDRAQFNARLTALQKKLLDKKQKEASRKGKQFQLHLLQKLQEESNLAEMEWIEHFPTTDYYLLHIEIINYHEKKSALDEKAFTSLLSKFSHLLHNGVYEALREQDYWIWSNNSNSYWVLWSIAFDQEHNPAAQLVRGIIEQTKEQQVFKLKISRGQRVEDLAMLPAIKKQEQSSFHSKQDLTSQKKYAHINTAAESILSSFKRNDSVLLKKNIERLAKQLTAISSKEAEEVIQTLGISLLHESLKITANTWDSNALHDLMALSASREGELTAGLMLWISKLTCTQTDTDSHRAIQEAKLWIDLHLSEPLTIEDIAARVYMNPTYFCSYFKKATGKTIHEYVTDERLEFAREQLLHTDNRVADIAISSGYTDTKYFSRLFKKHYGNVPSHYRKLHQGQ